VVLQAEDGIRNFHVTGVQTCALPIWRPSLPNLQIGIETGLQGGIEAVNDGAFEVPLFDEVELPEEFGRAEFGIAGDHADAGNQRSAGRRVGYEGSIVVLRRLAEDNCE